VPRYAIVIAAGLSVWLPLATTSHAVDGPGFELPPLTGPYQVATTSWRLTDTSRQETFSETGGLRQVEVLAWYPAAGPRKGALAPYLREGLAEVRSFAALLRAPETSFDGLHAVRTHAELDGAPAARPAKFPALVFSHGYTGIPSAYTALLEDLASHGFVVLSVVHPYEATAATLSDGRVVSLLDQAGTLRQGIRDVFAEWGPEDETMAAVTREAAEGERLRLLRGYLSGLRHTDIALRRWADDTKLVLDRLASLPSTSLPGRLAGRIDLNRLGVFGHSMGGVTAGQFCVEDRRCRAGLNLDGIPQYGTMIDKVLQRPFLMVYSARPGRTGASDAIYRRAASPYYRVDVRDTLHLEFSDMPFWAGALRKRGALGTMAPARASAITRAIVREYFWQELLGRRSPLLAGEPVFPEVTVRTSRSIAR
jgi:alpha-beta hydrolase superfamily lysophospholipase